MTHHYPGEMKAPKTSVRVSAPMIALVTATASVGILVVVTAVIRADPSHEDAPVTTVALAATALILLLQACVLSLRRFFPTASLLAIAALPVVLTAVGPNEVFTVTVVPVLVSVFLTGLEGAFSQTGRRVVAVVPLVAAGQFLDGLKTGLIDVPSLLVAAIAQALIVVAIPFLPATAMAAQRTARAARDETLHALTRERDAQIGEAIARERAEMARELHDIAAHHLSGISLMAGTVARQVASHPAAAREGALQVREQSIHVLEDLRRLVGLLRDVEEDQQVKTFSTIHELVDSPQPADAQVALEVRPRRNRALGDGVGSLAQLAAYRMVQESLTNVRRHAPRTRCTVLVDDTGSTTATVTVRNSPRPGSDHPKTAGSGLGILGMRERATLIGASFEAGPTADGGWRTRMDVPREHDHGGDMHDDTARDGQEAHPR